MSIRFTNLVTVFLLSILGLSVAHAQSLSGNYTIDANSTASGNYTSVAAAASALRSNGVSGAVTFTISDGTYSGQVTLGSGITGSSTTNTITFQSKSKDSSKVIITNNSNYTIYSTGTDNVIFKDVTISNTYTSTFYNIYLNSSSNNWKFMNCRIISNASGTFGYNVYNYKNNNNEFYDCRVVGGYYSMYNYGSGSGSNNNVGLVVKDCKIVKYYYAGMYNYYQANTLLSGNYVDSSGYQYSYGIRSYYGNNQVIRDNEVYGNSYGFYLYYENRTKHSSKDSTLFLNNISRGNATYGMYSYYSNNMDMHHNVFESVGSSYSIYIYAYQLTDWRAANNVFIATGTPYYGMYTYWGGGSYLPTYWDYNDYYFPNSTYHSAFNGSLANSLTAMKALYSSAYNQNSVGIDPEFSNAHDGRVYVPGLNNIGVDMGVDFDIDGNPRPNTADKKIDIGPNDYYLADQDLDVVDLVSPLSLTVGNNTVKTVFKNGGSKDITNETLYVHYSIDGGKNWITDTLDIKSLSPGKTIEFEFTKKLAITTSGTYTITIKIDKQISGDPDKEDEKSWDVCTGISGNYYVGSGANADFTTISDAVKQLKCGVAGPVVFNIQPGTYTENVLLSMLF